jgi:hypothetical protein
MISGMMFTVILDTFGGDTGLTSQMKEQLTKTEWFPQFLEPSRHMVQEKKLEKDAEGKAAVEQATADKKYEEDMAPVLLDNFARKITEIEADDPKDRMVWDKRTKEEKLKGAESAYEQAVKYSTPVSRQASRQSKKDEHNEDITPFVNFFSTSVGMLAAHKTYNILSKKFNVIKDEIKKLKEGPQTVTETKEDFESRKTTKPPPTNKL